MEKMDFGDAIKALKNGKRVSRYGWGEQGQYLYYVPAASYPAMTEIAVKQRGLNLLNKKYSFISKNIQK